MSIRHRIFSFSSSLSVVLCIIVLVLWARSHWFHDNVNHYSLAADGAHVTARLATVDSHRGTLSVMTNSAETYSPTAVRDHKKAHPVQGAVYWQKSPKNREVGEVIGDIVQPNLSFGFSRGFAADAYTTSRSHQVRFPYWLLLVITAVIPAFAMTKSKKGAKKA